MAILFLSNPSMDRFQQINSSPSLPLLQNIVRINVIRGGLDTNQSHNDWLSTVSEAPNVVAMSLVPITSLLNGVSGSGFLSHAINSYLRCTYFHSS